MSTLGDAADVYPVIKFLWHTCNVCGRNLITGSPRVDISSTCKVGQKLGVSLPLLTRSPSAWPSWILYRRGRKSRRDLWITLYMIKNVYQSSSKVPWSYSCQIWKTLGFSRQNFENSSSSESSVVPCGRTERQRKIQTQIARQRDRGTKPIFGFLQFCERT